MKTIIENISIVNAGQVFVGNVLIEDEYIQCVSDKPITCFANEKIDGKGKLLFPGVIDSHVHFRDPGLTHKADIKSESKAAIAGGVIIATDK